jgi:hypothetical protein
MAKNRAARGNQADNTQDMSLIVQKMNAMRFAIEQYHVAVEQYKAENPDIDVEALLSKQKELLPILGHLPHRELDKFITYAKEQGTNIPFQAMEMGVLAAGRKDMQNGLAEILDSLKFGKPVCPECNEKMDNRGRNKKKS